MIAPVLRKNSVIGICSPSSVADRDRYAHTIEVIEAMGFRVREADNLYKDTYGYNATPEERAADFHQLISDPEVKMVLFGGGEGGNELLPHLDFERIRANPKQLCSYSDGTTLLNVVWAQTGLVTYYGASPRSVTEGGAYDRAQFEQHLVRGDVTRHQPASPWALLHEGVAEGVMVGGYSRCFAMLLNGKYFPVDLRQKYILFLEDHEMFGGVDRVSAMISHIEQQDFIHSVAGLLFGHYSAPRNPELLARLKRFGEKYRVPVAYCDDFGHGEKHAILPIGRRARLDIRQGTLSYL